MIVSANPDPGDPDRRPHIAHLTTDRNQNDPDAVMLRNYVRLAITLGFARPIVVDSNQCILLSSHLWGDQAALN